MNPVQKFTSWICCQSTGDSKSSVTDSPASRVLPSLQCTFTHWVYGCTISVKKAPKKGTSMSTDTSNKNCSCG